MSHTGNPDNHRLQTPHAPAALREAPVVDIVTYGYKLAINLLWPMTRLYLPGLLLLLVAVVLLKLSGVEAASRASSGVQTNWVLYGFGMGFSLLSTPMMAYLCYVNSRYVRDVLRGDGNVSVLSSLRPDWTLFGCILLSVMNWFAFIPVWLVAGVGLLFLLVPGLIVLSYAVLVFQLVFAVYLQMPQNGFEQVLGNMFEAIGRVFRLVKNNSWRVAAIGMLCGILNLTLLTGLYYVPRVLTAFLEYFSPSMHQNGWFVLGYGLISAIGFWAWYPLISSAFYSVLFRLYYDLEARAEVTAPVEMADYRKPEAKPDIISS